MWGPLKAYHFMHSEELGEPCAFLEVKNAERKSLHASFRLHPTFTVFAIKAQNFSSPPTGTSWDLADGNISCQKLTTFCSQLQHLGLTSAKRFLFSFKAFWSSFKQLNCCLFASKS